MIFYILFISIFLVALFFFFFSKKNKKSDSSYLSDIITNEEEYNSTDINTDNFDKAYFEQIEKGEKSQQFLVLGSQQDCAIIRSLLAADNIPSYTENENINRMYGGIATAATSNFAIKLFILVKDYEKAYEIVCGYTKEMHEDEEKSIKTVTSEVISGLFFAPLPVDYDQKYFGITILPKLLFE